MIKFYIKAHELIKPLIKINNLISRRTHLPILNNILIKITNKNILTLIRTDLEIEIVINIKLNKEYEDGKITVSAIKLLKIFKNISENTNVHIEEKNGKIHINSDLNQFILSTLPISDFPIVEYWNIKHQIKLQNDCFKDMLESTYFAIAIQDLRYYLNGLLLEINNNKITAVATDGYRLALYIIKSDIYFPNHKIIIPRRGITELIRLLNTEKNNIICKIGSNKICFNINNITLTIQLINGIFPNYLKVFPNNPNKILKIESKIIRQALIRVSILSNEKFKLVVFYLNNNKLILESKNAEQEEAKEILNVCYTGEPIKIGFNVNYLIEIFNILKSDITRMLFTDNISSVQIESCEKTNKKYIIMPIII